MPSSPDDLAVLAKQIGADLAATVMPMFKRLEEETAAKIAEATVRSAFIDRDGSLVLTFGNGSTRNLGQVVGEDGKPGVDGQDGAIGPPGPAGEVGAAGRDGVDGKDGLEGQRGSDGLPGADGAPGQDGSPGLNGKDAEPIADAVWDRIEHRLGDLEGRTIRSAMIDRSGQLVLSLADGSTLTTGPVIGRDGMDGKDGVDGKPGKDGEIGPAGLGFDDLDVALHGDGRTVVVGFMRGEQVKRFEIALPAMVYRGVYEADRTYHPGDTVTFGGSAWVCNAQTSAKPGETEKTWTLAVKRGRDGKDFAGPQIKVPS